MSAAEVARWRALGRRVGDVACDVAGAVGFAAVLLVILWGGGLLM